MYNSNFIFYDTPLNINMTNRRQTEIAIIINKNGLATINTRRY